MPLTSGARLGPFEITALLGSGGMGEVYQATDTKLGRQVAIKVLPQLFASDPDRVARFEREAKLLASLNHPNIASIYGLEQADGVHFLVLELIEGETLAELITGQSVAESGEPFQATVPSRGRGAAERGGGAPRALKEERRLAPCR